MTFSQEWDEIYRKGQQITRWPWTDLVSAVKRNCGELKEMMVLELGCGAGANIPFFSANGAFYCGIDGSEEAVSLTQLIPGYLKRIVVGDFTKELPELEFDLIFDRAAVVHNDFESIRRCIDLVYNSLKPGGYYIGIDWFSTNHMNPEQFKDVGTVSYVDERILADIFKNFEIVSLEEKLVNTIVPKEKWFASFNIVVRKPL